MNFPAVSINYSPLGLNSKEAAPLSFAEEFDALPMVDGDD